jgi:predicted lipid-binding transport protein (Tim44 family)
MKTLINWFKWMISGIFSVLIMGALVFIFFFSGFLVTAAVAVFIMFLVGVLIAVVIRELMGAIANKNPEE